MTTKAAAAGRADPIGDSRCLGLALVVIAAVQLMVVLDATIVNVALPHIQREGGRGLHLIEEVSSSWGACTNATGDAVWAELAPGL